MPPGATAKILAFLQSTERKTSISELARIGGCREDVARRAVHRHGFSDRLQTFKGGFNTGATQRVVDFLNGFDAPITLNELAARCGCSVGIAKRAIRNCNLTRESEYGKKGAAILKFLDENDGVFMYSDLAGVARCSTSHARDAAIKNGRECRHRPAAAIKIRRLAQGGATTAEILPQVDVGRAQVVKARSPVVRAAKRAEILALRAQGLKPKEIAARVGEHCNLVNKALNDENVREDFARD